MIRAAIIGAVGIWLLVAALTLLPWPVLVVIGVTLGGAGMGIVSWIAFQIGPPPPSEPWRAPR